MDLLWTLPARSSECSFCSLKAVPGFSVRVSTMKSVLLLSLFAAVGAIELTKDFFGLDEPRV